jgi:hypothetical protein
MDLLQYNIPLLLHLAFHQRNARTELPYTYSHICGLDWQLYNSPATTALSLERRSAATLTTLRTLPSPVNRAETDPQ